MKEEEKIFAGQLFYPETPELFKIKQRSHVLCSRYNSTLETETEVREQLLQQILMEKGEGSSFLGPIFFHYGKHTRVGKGVWCNYDFTVQDDALVTIGDDTFFGPKCMIVTPSHPMIAAERKAMIHESGEVHNLCYAKPVTIGKNVWVGAGVIICGGVTIGDGAVIGAGSVVTRDVPENCFAAGSPAKIIREITEKDSMRYKPEILAGNQIITSDTSGRQ